MKTRFVAPRTPSRLLIAAALLAPLATLAQTEVQWWHSMTAVNGEWVNEYR